MLVSCRRTERPRGPLLQLGIGICYALCRIGGRLGSVALADVESTLKYHPAFDGYLTYARYPGGGQCQVGSLTGAVAS